MSSDSEHAQDVGAKTEPMDNDENAGKEPENQELFLSFALGNASLLAFNVIINAFDVYEELIARPNVSQDLTRCYQFPSSIMALLVIFLKPRNLKKSLIITLSLLVAGFIVFPALFLAKANPNILFIGAACTIVVVAAASAATFSCTNSLTSQFGPKAGAAASSGVGCCGVLATVLRLITKAAISNQPLSATIYFLLTLIIFAAVMVIFLIKARQPHIEEKLLADNGGGESPLSITALKNSWDTMKVVWLEWCSVAMVFLFTLTLFPGYVAGVRQDRKLGSWTLIMITGLFGIFDWIGRYLPSLYMWPKRQYAWIPVVARAVFFVILMISIQGVVDLNEPWWTIGWMIPFAITNGYSGTVSLIYGFTHEKLNMVQRKYAGLLVSCSVNMGILFSIAFTYALPTPKQLPFK